MPRTFNELLHRMQRLTQGIVGAEDLVKRFEERAVVRRWRRKTPYHPAHELWIDTRTARKDPVFVVFLPEGSKPPPDDALVWRQGYDYSAQGNVSYVLLVSTTPCHPDWLTLKTIYELGQLEVERATHDLLFRVVPIKGLDLDRFAEHVAPAVAHLYYVQERFFAQVVDRCLDDQVMSRVKRLKREMTTFLDARDLEHFARNVMRYMHRLSPQHWPEPLNQDEKHARYELLKVAARGLALSESREARLPD